MNEIQESLTQVKELSDADLIDVVVNGWEGVVEENNFEHDLVTDSQWETWVNMRDRTTIGITAVIERFSEPDVEGLSEDDKNFLLGLASNIVRSTHMTPEQIKEENAPKAVADEHDPWATPVTPSDVEVIPEDKESRKLGWLTRLKRLFTKP